MCSGSFKKSVRIVERVTHRLFTLGTISGLVKPLESRKLDLRATHGPEAQVGLPSGCDLGGSDRGDRTWQASNT